MKDLHSKKRRRNLRSERGVGSETFDTNKYRFNHPEKTEIERARQVHVNLHEEGVEISVRRAERSDYPAIERFLNEAYGKLASFKVKNRWYWQFVDNPYAQSEKNGIPVWIAESDGRVVGQIAVQKGELELDGSKHSAGWIVDVFVLPSYRGRGLAQQLYAAVARECPIVVTLTMAPATRRIAESLCAVDVGTVKLYWRGAHLDPLTVQRYLLARTFYHPCANRAVRRLCNHLSMHRVLTRVGNLFLELRDRFRSLPPQRKDTVIVETNRFDSDTDWLWQTLNRDFPVAFTRESKFLNWRFRDCPQMQYRCFLACREGVPVGYLVLRQTESVELPYGVIVDLIASRRDHDTIQDLVTFAIKFFAGNVAGLQCATSIPAFAAVLRKLGFYSIETERPNCVVEEGAVRERLERSSTEWLFSKADHDWDQINVA
jgi:GNAT superfamily N-acetyltransferase